MNTSLILLIASIIASIGGWMITLSDWASATTPVSIGGLLMIVGSVIAAWLGKSPISIKPPKP